MQRLYEPLAPFHCGRAILQTGISGDTGRFNRKRRVALLPLDKFLDYLYNPEAVRYLLGAARDKLVENYNAQKVKSPIDWRDEMSRHHFLGSNGKAEMTAWELRIHTYGFWCSDSPRPIEKSDLTVQTTAS
jgi:hypothetical protein